MANIINGTDTGSGGLITTGDSSDELQLQTAEVARVTLTNTAVVVNESGADVDFRVEGDTEANLLFVDASTDRVGIGTSSPARALTVFSSSSGNNVRLYNVGFTSLEIVSDRVTPTQNIGGISFLDSTTATASQIVGQVDGVLAFVNGGLERMRFTSDAASFLRMASGTGGIQFNGDTAAANALDDYEEGTWTPVFKFGATIATQSGTNTSYTKIGRQVTCFVEGYITNLNGGTGTFEISGLPFTNLSMRSTQGVFLFTNMSATFPAGDKSAYIESGDTSLVPVYFTGASGTVSALQHTDFTTSSYVYAQIVYFV